MQIKCKITATVLQDNIKEYLKDGKTFKEHQLMCHQDGGRETIKVIVPLDEKFEKYAEYEFQGYISIFDFKGKSYVKFVSK